MRSLAPSRSAFRMAVTCLVLLAIAAVVSHEDPALGLVECPTERLWFDASGRLEVRVWCGEVPGSRASIHVTVGQAPNAATAWNRTALGGGFGRWGWADDDDVRADRPVADWSVDIGWCPAAAHVAEVAGDPVVLLVGHLDCAGGQRMAAAVSRGGIAWTRTYSEMGPSLGVTAHGQSLWYSWVSADAAWATLDFRDGDVVGVRLRDGSVLKMSAPDVEARRPERAGDVPKYLDTILRHFGAAAAESAFEHLEMDPAMRGLARVYLDGARAGQVKDGPAWDWAAAWARYAASVSKSGAKLDVRAIAETVVEFRPSAEACAGAVDVLAPDDAISLCRSIARAGFRGEDLVRGWAGDEKAPSARRTAAKTALEALDDARRASRDRK